MRIVLFIILTVAITGCHCCRDEGAETDAQSDKNSINALTQDGKHDYEIKSMQGARPATPWERAARNTFAVLDGGGTLVRVADRGYIISARHVVQRTGLATLASKDGRVYTMKILKLGAPQDVPNEDGGSDGSDFAVLEFADRKEELECLTRYGGARMTNVKPKNGRICFSIRISDDLATQQRELETLESWTPLYR